MSSCPISSIPKISKWGARSSMTSPGYKSFAIWGAGNMGRHIVEELLALKVKRPEISIMVLTRPSSINSKSNEALATSGAHVIPFDVVSPSASSLLKGIDVFITTIGGRALHLQPAAAEAAARAGVKIFVPADWGDRIWERDGIWQRGQQAAHAAADRVGIKTASFFCGLWPERIVLSGAYGWFLAHGKIEILGEGTNLISFTSKLDVARYAVHSLTTFPRSVLEGGEFYIQGQAISLRDLAFQVQAASTRPLEISVTGRQALLDRLAENRFNIPADVCLGADRGLSHHTKFVRNLDNERWPEWNPRSAVEVVVALLPK